MKTIEEFREFYNTVLIQDLNILETQRKKLLPKIIVVNIACVFIFWYFAFFFIKSPYNFACIVFVIFTAAIINNIMTFRYTKNFKTDIIGKIAKFINQALCYSPLDGISQDEFEKSRIFLNNPNEYYSKDLVSGVIDNNNIRFSFVDATYKDTDNSNTTFFGLYFISDFNKTFQGNTVVLPDIAENLFGKFGQALQAINISRYELIRLEDPEFEKYFKVCSDNQITSRYILSTSLMKKIVDFKNKTGKKIYLSFVDSHIYIVIPYTSNLFEPKIFTSIIDFDKTLEYYEHLQFFIGIVDDLNLNNDIWK